MLVKSFAHLMLWIFCDPPERGGLTLNIVEYAELHYKLSTPSKVYLSPPWRLEKNSHLNVRNFWPRLYIIFVRWSGVKECFSQEPLPYFFFLEKGQRYFFLNFLHPLKIIDGRHLIENSMLNELDLLHRNFIVYGMQGRYTNHGLIFSECKKDKGSTCYTWC